jgi:nucleoside-diphosphate-sugar epimerase
MRILVTGVAGFIGSHLAERLLTLGHDVVGVDSFITGSWLNLAAFAHHPHFAFVNQDVVQPLALDGPLDWVMHFASPASPPKYQQNAVHTLRTNAEGTHRMLELALQRSARFLFAGTSEVYGDPTEHPQREDYWGHVNPVGPRSMYDEGKRYAESLATSYHRDYGLPVHLVRIFNTYGPRMRPDDGRVIVNFITQALASRPLTVYGDGRQTRSFQYIDDLIEGLLRFMQVDYARPVNLGNPEEYTMLQLAGMVKSVTGSDSPIVFEPLPEDDPRQRCPDISRARALLDWHPRVPLQRGLRLTTEYFAALRQADCDVTERDDATVTATPFRRRRHRVAGAEAAHHDGNGNGTGTNGDVASPDAGTLKLARSGRSRP